jgi:hypothetical protein
MGIHQVAVAQYQSENPFRNGSSSRSSDDAGAARISIAPARPEMAIAPMLIQYGRHRRRVGRRAARHGTEALWPCHRPSGLGALERPGRPLHETGDLETHP